MHECIYLLSFFNFQYIYTFYRGCTEFMFLLSILNTDSKSLTINHISILTANKPTLCREVMQSITGVTIQFSSLFT